MKGQVFCGDINNIKDIRVGGLWTSSYTPDKENLMEKNEEVTNKMCLFLILNMICATIILIYVLV